MVTAQRTADTTIPGAAPSLTELASGILDDAQRLLHQQISLFRAEIAADLRRTRYVAQCFGIGILFVAFSAAMLLVAGVHALAQFAAWPMWAAWLTVGGVTLLIGLVSIIVGSRILASYNPLPDKSFNAIQENVSCLINHQK